MSAATIQKILDNDPKLRAIVVSAIVDAVDAKIADLQNMRSDLSGEVSVAPAAEPVTPKRGRGRPKGSKNKTTTTSEPKKPKKTAKKTVKAKAKGKGKGGRKPAGEGPGHTDKLLKVFEDSKGKKGTAAELREAIPGGMEAGTFHSTVGALMKSERVTKTGEGREAVYKLVK